MATVSKSTPIVDPANPPQDLRRFSVEDYYRMAEAGMFRPDEHTELLDGVIYYKNTDPLERHRFDVEDYYRLAEMGILFPDERLELLDGEIFEMSPIGSSHAACVRRFNKKLVVPLGDRAIVMVQDPIRLAGRYEPQPDLAIVRFREDFYCDEHPRAADVFFLIEVMDSSTPRDRKEKLRKYALAGIPEVWLADLNNDQLEAHRKPLKGIYTEVQIRISGQTISPEAFPDLVLQIDDILG